ncbi:MAG: recombinase family protein [Solirubrobacterales bacterium]|nr:recombinase family protein [Solirubrobacterales bacterium]
MTDHSGAPAILYGAKSTQDRRRSLKTQLEDAREFAEEHGWNVVAEYKDEGFSAYSGNRGPGLRSAEMHAARLAAEAGTPCMLVTQAADRFARGAGDAPGASEHLAEIWHRWRRFNVWMRTAEDDEYMHSAERVAQRGELAHLESKRKSRSVTKGMRRRRQGDQAEGQLPRHTGGAVYGYNRDDAKGLVPDPLTGPVVVRIFTMAAAHKSLVEIAQTLQAELEVLLLEPLGDDSRGSTRRRTRLLHRAESAPSLACGAQLTTPIVPEAVFHLRLSSRRSTSRSSGPPRGDLRMARCWRLCRAVRRP